MAKNPVRHQGFALLLLLAGAAALPAAAQTTRWTRQFGSAQMDQANGVAVAPSGVYVIGTTSPGGQGIPVNSDVIVRKYNFDGLLLWSDQFGTPNTDEGLAVAANASGVYFAGMIGGTTAQAEGFLRKYDASGNLLWTRQFGGANEIVAAKAVAADSSAVYVAGSATAANSGFLRKYDLNGNLIWEIASSSGSIPGVTGLASDGSYLYLSGPPAPLLPGQSEAGTFVRKYDANGNAVWTRQFGASSNARVNAIATDGSNLYMAGTVSGILPGQSGAGGSDAFVRKYDADGNELWTRQFGSASLDEGFGVSADPTGVYIAGQAGGTLPGQQSGGGQDFFVQKRDVNGNDRWTRQIGSVNVDAALGASSDTAALYVGGYALDALPGQAGSGGRDAFIAKFDLGGPPFVPFNGIVDGASYVRAVAPGSIASAFGYSLTPQNPASLLVQAGGITVPIFAATPAQINFQVPWELAGQQVAFLIVSGDGNSSAPVSLPLAAYAPAIFSADSSGAGQGAILIANSASLAAPAGMFPGSRPVQRGEFISIYATGLGPVTNQPPTGIKASANPPSLTTAPVTVTIGGIPVTPTFSGLAPDFFGLYQVNAQVPLGVAPGNAVPVTLTIFGSVSNTVTMAVQ